MAAINALGNDGTWTNNGDGTATLTDANGNIVQQNNQSSTLNGNLYGSSCPLVYNYWEPTKGSSFETDDYHGDNSFTEGAYYLFTGVSSKGDQFQDFDFYDDGGQSDINYDWNIGLNQPSNPSEFGHVVKYTAIGLNFGVDIANLTVEGAKTMSKASVNGLKTLTKTTGLIGVALGGGLAIYDIYKNGWNWNNATALGLGIISGIILAVPGVGEAAESLSLAVDAGTLTNDVIGIINDKGK